MPVNAVDATQNTGYTPTPVGSAELDKTAFLSLLVAQLKNQDPLQPMSNTEFVAQLAQFSSIEQLVAVNEGINVLGIQQMGMSNAQAASFIGQNVEIKSSKFDVLETDLEASAAFRLDGDAETVEVKIRDSSGTVVRTLQLGTQQEGDVPINWDLRNDNGVKVAPGVYTLDVVATSVDGNPVTWEARVQGIVDGVDYESGYPQLVIGSIKASLSDVIGVYPADQTGP